MYIVYGLENIMKCGFLLLLHFVLKVSYFSTEFYAYIF